MKESREKAAINQTYLRAKFDVSSPAPMDVLGKFG